jgi:hypothetical protein
MAMKQLHKGMAIGTACIAGIGAAIWASQPPKPEPVTFASLSPDWQFCLKDQLLVSVGCLKAKFDAAKTPGSFEPYRIAMTDEWNKRH